MSLFAEDVRNEFGHQTIQIMKDQLIGTGAYGSVCHASIDQLSCAAKTVHPALLQMRDPGSGHILQRFHAECEIMSRLRHPNIVQYIGTATDPDTRTPVLLMELLDCSLTQFLEETENPLPYYVQINFSHDIALACAYLHYNNVIHRDLSANNILLLGRMRAKVGDFGMARLLNRSVASPELTICPGAQVYMPPEALTDPAVYNAKVDVFSIGVLFIQMMTKCFPIPKERFREENRFGETVRIIVPEVERREQHIRQINAAHPLLPIAKQCLQDNEIRRPTSDRLCQQIMQLKLNQTYHESKQARVLPARQRGQRQDSQESLQQLNADLVRELEEKELLNEGQQQENRHLIEQLQQKERELQEARSRNGEIEQMLTQERRRLESLQTQFSRIRMWEHGPQGGNSVCIQSLYMT